MRLVGWEGTKTLGIDELVANADMVRGFLAHEADVDAFDSVLVRKPLRQAAGGVGHQGGDQFYDLADPDLLLMVCWMEGGGPECGP